jgi:hypothetical protein
MFLLAQGIELAVKAWLVQYGDDLNFLKSRKVGHDLYKLFVRAASKGFPLAGLAEQTIVHTLNLTYAGGKQLQYPVANASMWPSPRAVRELLHEVIRSAAAAIFPEMNLDRVTAADHVAWAGVHIEKQTGYAGPPLTLLREMYPGRGACDESMPHEN